ncbi:hypothetical protein Vadar_008803 [Vaccinium darrowii]|uniref:Uncharacterized protein n=1 Tax=Vaccinium darrowii TaxID=229202 RepID=A0ACB7WYX3_9ERIC|nr:hypothetical protein Vadar_008803 [Vaccinium darrowii]
MLAKEVEKINTQLAQREEAMKKSRHLLFSELSKYLGLGPEELKERLKEMKDEDKWVLVKGFVSEWGEDFHPLSARSVKEMVEEHLVEDTPPQPAVSSPSVSRHRGVENMKTSLWLPGFLRGSSWSNQSQSKLRCTRSEIPRGHVPCKMDEGRVFRSSSFLQIPSY